MTEPDGEFTPTPARGYSWPPFEAGNTAALRHGAWSPRKVDPIAAELVERVTSHLEWLTPADAPSVWAWARAEAQVTLLSEYLQRAGEETGDGVGDLEADRIKSAYTWLHRAEQRAASGRARLGLDPLSRARLGRDVAASQVDLAKLMAEEHERQTSDALDGDGEGPHYVDADED